VKGLRVLYDIKGIDHSYTYFPVLIDEMLYGESRDSLYKRLKRNNIYGRRYFFPLISQFPTYRGLPSARSENLPCALNASEQVICLPIYPNLEIEASKRIIGLIKDNKL
jgi:dTDP-4-amino-4,6-dideoxygalactose transaminase